MPAPLYPNVSASHLCTLLDADLVNCKVKLFQNDYQPNPDTVKANLTVATFSGYADKTVAALLPPYYDPIGGASTQIGTLQWDHNGGVNANTIFGWWVENAGGDLIIVGRFDTPVGMSSLGDSIPLDIKFNFGN